MNKTTKLIVMSLLTVAMCVSLVAGATFALFTSQSNIDITVTSGKVSVKADVADVQYASDTTDNYVWQPAVEEAGVFSGSFAVGGMVTYTVATNELALINIAPGDAVKFTVNITNASTVKVKYILRVSASSDAGLYDLLNITADGEKLSGSPAVITEWAQLAATDGTDNAVDSVEMVIALPSAVDNDGADKSCTLTLTVLAVQGNGATCADEGVAHHYVDDVCTWCGEANPYKGSVQTPYGETEQCYKVSRYTGTEEDVTVPAEINGYPVSFTNSFMDGNTTVKSVTFESGITNLQQFTFRNCTNLQEVNLPDTLEVLMASTFAGCTSLKKVTIPASVKELDNEVFARSAVEEIDFVSEGSQLESIDWRAFGDCTNLTTLNLPERAFQFTGMWGFNSPKKVLRDTKLYNTDENWISDSYGNSLLYIGNHLIAVKPHVEGKNIQGLEIRPGTVDIAPIFFYNLNSGTSFYQIIEPVQIPDSVEIIDQEAFGVTQSNHVAVTPVFGADSHLKYIGVKAFYNFALSGFEASASITLPASVEYIDSQAFYNNTSYYRTTFTIKFADSDSYNLKYVAMDAFAGYNSEEGVYDNGRYIGSNTNPYLILAGIVDDTQETFVVHDGTEHIVTKFSANLTSVTLSNTLKIIYSETFASCKNLASVTIPASVMRIEGYAFGRNAKDNPREFSVTLEGEGTWYQGKVKGSYGDEVLKAIIDVDFSDPTSIGASLIKYVLNQYSVPYGLPDWVRVTD